MNQTVEKRMAELLEDHGLWPQEAQDAMAKAKADTALASMAKRWDDDVSGYEGSLLATLWISVRSTALEFLKQSKPQHFAIMVLEGIPQ